MLRAIKGEIIPPARVSKSACTDSRIKKKRERMRSKESVHPPTDPAVGSPAPGVGAPA